jgi:hypothetical protein
MKENWFPAQICPDLVAAKGMLHNGSLLFTHIFFCLNGP